MKKEKILSLLISVIVAAGLLAGCSSGRNTGGTESDSVNTVGNTNGNISNGGMAAKLGDWIYYVNSGDNDRIYKIKSDGTEKTKLADDEASNINAAGEVGS